MINSTNYESYFLDFLEAKLSPEAEAELREFLTDHPHLGHELTELHSWLGVLSVPAIPVAFHDKHLLRQIESESDLSGLPPADMRFEETASLRHPSSPDLDDPLVLLTAFAEGDLSGKALERAQKLILTQPQLGDEAARLQQMRLPVTDISFPNKKVLYQTHARAAPLLRYLSYAAAAAIAALLILILTPDAHHRAYSAVEKGRTPQGVERILPVHRDVQPQGARMEIETSIDVIKVSAPPLSSSDELAVAVEPMGSRPIANLPEAAGALLPVSLIASPLPSSGTMGTGERAESIPTVYEYAETTAKEKLWGSDTYPAKGFALALAQREFNRHFGMQREELEFTRVHSGKTEEITVRIGRFSYVRKKA